MWGVPNGWLWAAYLVCGTATLLCVGYGMLPPNPMERDAVEDAGAVPPEAADGDSVM